MKTQKSFSNSIRAIAALLFFVLMCSGAWAQLSESKIGVRVGTNLSYWKLSDGVTAVKMQPGYMGGAFLRLQLQEHLALQPEVSYMSQTMDVTTYTNANEKEVTAVSFNNYEFGTMAVISFFKNFNVHAGPYAYYRGGVRLKTKEGDEISTLAASIDKDSFHPLEFGLAGGAGLDVGLLMVGVRWYSAFNPMGKDVAIQPDEQNETLASNPFAGRRNNLVSVYLGIGF